MQDLNRDMGRHDAQIEALAAKMDRMELKIDQIETTLSEARGGWQIIMWVAGASGAVGAVMSWAASKLSVST